MVEPAIKEPDTPTQAHTEHLRAEVSLPTGLQCTLYGK